MVNGKRIRSSFTFVFRFKVGSFFGPLSRVLGHHVGSFFGPLSGQPSSRSRPKSWSKSHILDLFRTSSDKVRIQNLMKSKTSKVKSSLIRKLQNAQNVTTTQLLLLLLKVENNFQIIVTHCKLRTCCDVCHLTSYILQVVTGNTFLRFLTKNWRKITFRESFCTPAAHTTPYIPWQTLQIKRAGGGSGSAGSIT